MNELNKNENFALIELINKIFDKINTDKLS